MTREEIKDLIFKTCPEGAEISTGWESGYDWNQAIKLMTAAYNLAIDHAAEKATSSAYPKGVSNVDKESILNLKITE